MNKNKVLVVSAAIIAAIAASLWLSQSGPIDNKPKDMPAINVSISDLSPSSSKRKSDSANNELAPSEAEKIQAEKIKFLRAQYGVRISNPYWQIKMIDQLMGFMKKEFPLSWESELIKLFHLVFPDYADALTAKLYAHIEYIAWVDALKNNLTFENQDDRRQALWDKRLELFGEDAYQIWEAVLKQDKFDAQMKSLAQSTDSFDSKKEEYIKSMKTVFGENILQAGHKTQIINHFLTLDNVQSDLRNMPAEQRRAQLHNYRQSMGLDDAALVRWNTLDKQRDTLRDTGNNYMQQREQLANQHEGEALAKKVELLRIDLFGEVESKVISNEETSGYYRFNTPQKFGFN